MHLTGRGGKLAATTLAFACLGGGIAEARLISTKLTIDNDNDTFSGSLSSKKAKCERDRKVVLFKQTGDGKKRIGADTSDDNGDWSIDSEKTGKFFAVVNPNKNCTGAASKVIKVVADDDDDE